MIHRSVLGARAGSWVGIGQIDLMVRGTTTKRTLPPGWPVPGRGDGGVVGSVCPLYRQKNGSSLR